MLCLAIVTTGCLLSGAEAEPLFESALIFDPKQEIQHGHVHASCIVECPNGDLRVCWYENGPTMPPPYFSEEGDKSADVRIAGARKPAGAEAWEKPLVMTDTFGVSDNNPCMTIDGEGRLWLVYATLLAVPQNAWGSALVHYHVSSDYAGAGVPKWERENILAVHPRGFEKAMMAAFEERAKTRKYSDKMREKRLESVNEKLQDVYKLRLGWMPRVHPLVRSDGAVMVPLANENYNIAAMAFSKDGGQTWFISEAVPGIGVTQPTVVEFEDGKMAAFFRNSGSGHCILRSDSEDGGMTWTALAETELPNPDAGIEAVLLANGHLAMIYNDNKKDPRDLLAVSISTDRGETWKWTRYIENEPGQRFDYPSLVQGKDGSLHATYSYNTKTIKYAHFNEAWVQAGN